MSECISIIGIFVLATLLTHQCEIHLCITHKSFDNKTVHFYNVTYFVNFFH